MKTQNLKTEYLKKAYILYCLFDQRKYLIDRYKGTEFYIQPGKKGSNERQKDMRQINEKIKKTESEIAEIVKEANVTKQQIPFEDIAIEYGLNHEEKYIILMLFFDNAESTRARGTTGKEVLKLLGYTPDKYIEKSELFENLLKKRLIEIKEDECLLLFEAEFTLARNVIKTLSGNSRAIKGRRYRGSWFFSRTDRKEYYYEIVNVRKPLLSFDQIVLETEMKDEIERAIFQAQNLQVVMDKWGLGETIKYGRCVSMLFYGPPGTGKTATCEAIADALKKNIGIVNYAQVLGSFVGDSEKGVVKIFEQAKENDCVLVFDEADSLFARRINEIYSTDRMHNYMTNVLMQELERFEGVVILTTNREVVMDEAFERRIILKLKFDVPQAKERARIWRTLIPRETPLIDDIDFEELGRRFELTGGEIKNVILNAAVDCAGNGLEGLTMLALLKFAEKEVKKAKRNFPKSLGFKMEESDYIIRQ